MKDEISRILKMLENGKISAEQASSLIRTIRSIGCCKQRRRRIRKRLNLQASRGDYMTRPEYMGINPLRSCMEGMTYK